MVTHTCHMLTSAVSLIHVGTLHASCVIMSAGTSACCIPYCAQQLNQHCWKAQCRSFVTLRHCGQACCVFVCMFMSMVMAARPDPQLNCSCLVKLSCVLLTLQRQSNIQQFLHAFNINTAVIALHDAGPLAANARSPDPNAVITVQSTLPSAIRLP